MKKAENKHTFQGVPILSMVYIIFTSHFFYESVKKKMGNSRLYWVCWVMILIILDKMFIEVPNFTSLISENHRTQTQYDDALIIKLFAFQFANSYASCFYIAFFRGVS